MVCQRLKSIYERAVEHYGLQHQMMICSEEMSELNKELCKNIRGEKNNQAIAEEIADVEIMLTQLKMALKVTPSVIDWKIKKLERLEDRIKNGY